MILKPVRQSNAGALVHPVRFKDRDIITSPVFSSYALPHSRVACEGRFDLLRIGVRTHVSFVAELRQLHGRVCKQKIRERFRFRFPFRATFSAARG